MTQYYFHICFYFFVSKFENNLKPLRNKNETKSNKKSNKKQKISKRNKKYQKIK